MFFRKSKLIQALRLEIQRLREALARTEGERDAYREQAREAIGLAHEKHFPSKSTGLSGTSTSDWVKALNEVNKTVEAGVEQILSNYIPPTVRNCPECLVSVRAEEWPQECPGCHCTFGFEE